MLEKAQPENRIADILTDFVERSEALTALLLNKDGTPITTAGDKSLINSESMAALIAGMFAATRSVARMVDEKEFSMLLQQGEKRHLHIALINDSIMLTVIFEGIHRIGRIRHESRKISEKLQSVLAESNERNKAQSVIPVVEFKEVALNIIDNIFTQK